MANIVRPFAVSLLPLGLACGAAAMSSNGVQALEGGATPLPRCEIRTARLGHSIELEGLVFADAPLSGSYRLRVSQTGPGGSSDITQGGEFTAAPGEAGSLGIVTLPGAGSYHATLKLEWNGGALDCHAGTQDLRRATIDTGEEL